MTVLGLVAVLEQVGGTHALRLMSWTGNLWLVLLCLAPTPCYQSCRVNN